MKIYAKTLNPENYDYRMYEDIIEEHSEIMLLGNRDNPGYNDDLLKKIIEVADDYNDYILDIYYNNSIKEYVEDKMPKKENGKRWAPSDYIKFKKAFALEKTMDYRSWVNEFIKACLYIIKGKNYRYRELRGSCQGDWIQCWFPDDEDMEVVLFIEAWYFGTGTEVLVNVDKKEKDINGPDDLEGFTFYTRNYKLEDIKREVIENYGPVTREGEEVEVVLWTYRQTLVIRKDIYQLAS